jgi:hypothetical protein
MHRLRNLLAAAIVMSLPVLADAQPLPGGPPGASSPGLSSQSLAIGVGAVAAVVAFNAATLGLGAFPGGAAYAAGATVPAEMAVAMNRLYAVTTAVAGAWIGEYAYAEGLRSTDTPTPHGRLVAAALGAIAGVSAFTLATAPFSPVPLAGGALEPVPVSVMLGSRIAAVTTAGIGALAANALYNGATDLDNALTLFGGALGGVVAGNLLIAGQIGILPIYAGAGAAEAGGAIASTAANTSSRALAVVSGITGAMAARWWYGTQP